MVPGTWGIIQKMYSASVVYHIQSIYKYSYSYVSIYTYAEFYPKYAHCRTCLVQSLAPVPTASCPTCFYYQLIAVYDDTWWHRSGSTLSQVMVWSLVAPSHYLDQCWLIIDRVLYNLRPISREVLNISICDTSLTRPTLERRKTLGHLRSINRNMIIHFANQSQTWQPLKIKKKTVFFQTFHEKWCNQSHVELI